MWHKKAVGKPRGRNKRDLAANRQGIGGDITKTEKMYRLDNITPFAAIHPGELVRDELNERGMTQKQLAEIIGMPAPVLNDIIKGRRNINTETAILLQDVFGIEARLWLALQSQYDIDKATIDARLNKRRAETKSRKKQLALH